MTLKGHTVYLLSHELLWCGNTTATATLPKSSALWVLCRKHPHWVSHIVSICIDNDGPKSWTLQLDGRLVPRLGSDKVSIVALHMWWIPMFFSELCLVDGFNYAALFSRRNGMFVWLSTFFWGDKLKLPRYHISSYHRIYVKPSQRIPQTKLPIFQ